MYTFRRSTKSTRKKNEIVRHFHDVLTLSVSMICDDFDRLQPVMAEKKNQNERNNKRRVGVKKKKGINRLSKSFNSIKKNILWSEC